jgi:hypothetical protein
MMKRRREVNALLVLISGLALALATISAGASADDLVIQALLSGPTLNGMTPRGVAVHRTKANGSRKFEVEVEDVNLPAGTALDVLVSGNIVGSLILNSFHEGELELETERAQVVPVITAGTIVVVRTQAAITIVSGTFSAAPPMPSPGASPSPTPKDDPNELIIRAVLSGPPINGETPRGKAEHHTKTDGRRKLEVEVEDINLPAGTVLDVFVDGPRIGSLTLNSFREGELELETEEGQIVPIVNPGTIVSVKTLAGATVVSGAFSFAAPTPSPTPDDNGEAKNKVQFTAVGYGVSEGAGSLVVTVTRAGDLSRNSKVDFRSSDGTAKQRSDYTTVAGRLFFAPGEASKTITVLITDDGFAEGDETFFITLTDASDRTDVGTPGTAIVTIKDNDPTPASVNPIDASRSFVVQHYMDFLNREPDPGGLNAWQNVLNSCQPGDDRCDRIHVSSGFFRSPEFQDRGYFLYRFYSVSLGRKPDYAEFEKDMSRTSGFQTEAEQEASKALFADDFVTRQEFKDRLDRFTRPADYVNALLATCGVNTANKDALIAALQNGQTNRAQVLRSISESPEVRGKFYNQAFVVMQYFGYLRRDPDSLYLDWIRTMDETGDYRTMINGFMNAAEYRQRFGP